MLVLWWAGAFVVPIAVGFGAGILRLNAWTALAALSLGLLCLYVPAVLGSDADIEWRWQALGTVVIVAPLLALGMVFYLGARYGRSSR